MVNIKKVDKRTVVFCPTCQTDVIWNDRHQFRPFCSQRCKLIDLGEWASEQKRIPGESVHFELNEEDNPFLH